jgi:ATP-dependent Clp protease ATP-binding subunit ClpA
MNETSLPPDKNERLRNLAQTLRADIRGQQHIIPRVVSVLQRGELGLSKVGRPRGSFLFLGPTGVGKTELTQVFTGAIFGMEKLIRFDMSEFQTQESLGLLLGSRAGESGFLGAAYNRTKTGTLLFDEVEKAHPRIMDVFLQILDAARVTIATGETLDLSGFYVVMTSNIGSAELMTLQHSAESTLERHVLSRAQQSLRPEIFARVTEKLVFHRLSYEHQLEIAAKFLDKEIKFLGERGCKLQVSESVLPFLVRKGFHPKLGARPMRDATEKLVGDAVAETLLQNGSATGCLMADTVNDCLKIGSPALVRTPGATGLVNPGTEAASVIVRADP